jgi:hypothetical protein
MGEADSAPASLRGEPNRITAYLTIEGDSLPDRLERLTAAANEIGGISIHAISEVVEEDPYAEPVGVGVGELPHGGA